MKGILDRLSSLQLDRQKIILLIFALVVFVYFDFSFLLKLQSRSCRNLSSRATKIAQDLKKFRHDLSEMHAAQTGPGAVQGLVRKKIISEEEVPDLLDFISDLANKNNVRIAQLKPGRQQGSDAALAINLELIAGYHALGAFLNSLENAQYFLAVKGIKISRSEKDAFNEDVSLQLQAYVKK